MSHERRPLLLANMIALVAATDPEFDMEILWARNETLRKHTIYREEFVPIGKAGEYEIYGMICTAPHEPAEPATHVRPPQGDGIVRYPRYACAKCASEQPSREDQ